MVTRQGTYVEVEVVWFRFVLPNEERAYLTVGKQRFLGVVIRDGSFIIMYDSQSMQQYRSGIRSGSCMYHAAEVTEPWGRFTHQHTYTPTHLHTYTPTHLHMYTNTPTHQYYNTSMYQHTCIVIWRKR